MLKRVEQSCVTKSYIINAKTKQGNQAAGGGGTPKGIGRRLCMATQTRQAQYPLERTPATASALAGLVRAPWKS